MTVISLINRVGARL